MSDTSENENENDRSPEDRKIDEELEETFPASDAPSHTGETGVRIEPPSSPPPDDDDRHENKLLESQQHDLRL